MESASAGVAVSLDDQTIIKPVLHHANLKTTRLDELIEWYRVVVGLEPNFRNPGMAFLTNDAANHRLALAALPGLTPDLERARHDGMHHLAFEYQSLDGLLGTYVRLKREGILPEFCLDHGLTMSFYYADPDGNFVELQSDNYGDWSKSTEFLRNDQRFVEDPIGKFVDPDALVEARCGGAAPEDLHERAYRSEFLPAELPDLGIPE